MLQPPARHQRLTHLLGDDGAEPAIGKRLLGIGQDIFLLVALDEIDAVGMQSHLSQRRKKQVRPCQAPDNRSRRSSRDAGGEQRGRRAIDRAGPATRDLMKRAVGKTAAGQGGIDLRHLKRQRTGFARGRALHRGDALSQLGYHPVSGSIHRSRTPAGSCWQATSCRTGLFVLYLFLTAKRVKPPENRKIVSHFCPRGILACESLT